jgi:hypothetical protein
MDLLVDTGGTVTLDSARVRAAFDSLRIVVQRDPEMATYVALTTWVPPAPDAAVEPEASSTSDVPLMLIGGGIILVGLVITLLVRHPSKTQWFALRLFLAVGALVLGAGLPGLFIEVASGGIRAAGAGALFLIVYRMNPPPA